MLSCTKNFIHQAKQLDSTNEQRCLPRHTSQVKIGSPESIVDVDPAALTTQTVASGPYPLTAIAHYDSSPTSLHHLSDNTGEFECYVAVSPLGRYAVHPPPLVPAFGMVDEKLRAALPIVVRRLPV